MAEEKIILDSPFHIKEFKKFLDACSKLTKETQITLNRDGVTLTCGEYFKFRGNAPPEAFTQFEIEKEHKVCQILIDDIHDLITKKIDRLEIVPQDSKIKVNFISGLNKVYDAEIGESC